MLRNKILLLILTVFITGLLFSACSGNEDGDKSEITVTDGMGKEIALEGKPEKIVSLTLGTDEILLEIVERDRIKGLSYLSEDEGMSNIIDKVEGIDKMKAETEQVIAAQPDIVFVAGWSDADFIKQLEEAGISVYTVATPNNVEEVKGLIGELASVLGVEDEGERLVEWMDEKLDAVSKKVSGLSEDKRMTVLSIDAFYNTYGKGSTFDSVAEHAGVINMASENGIEKWAEISKEQVVEMNPNILLLPSWSFEGFDAEEFAQDFKTDKALEKIDAVKNNRVYALPEAHMSSFSHNIVLGVEDLAKAAYPQLFNEE